MSDYSLVKRIEKLDSSVRTPEQSKYLDLLTNRSIDWDGADPLINYTDSDIAFVRNSGLWEKSFFLLDSTEIQWLNAWALSPRNPSPMTTSIERWRASDIQKALGIEVIPQEENDPPTFKHNGIKYRMRHNKTNRSYLETNAKHLFRQALVGGWALNGETLIFDDQGQAGSAQHRAGGWYSAFLTNPSIPPIPVTVIRGVPAPLIGSVDTGRRRTNKDELARFNDLIPDHLLVDSQGHGYGSKREAVKGKVAKIIDGALRKVWLRMQGKDINGSTTSTTSKFDQGTLFEMLELSHTSEGGVAWLCARCFAALEGFKAGATPISLYSADDYAAALILYSNPDNPAPYSIEGGKTVHKRIFDLPETLNVDAEFCSAFLDSLKMGWTAPNYDYVSNTDKGAAKADKRHLKFASLIECVKWFAAHRKQATSPGLIDPTTGEQQPDTIVQTCEPLAKHTFPTQRSGTIWIWSHFGGLDCGYLEPLKGEASL